MPRAIPIAAIASPSARLIAALELRQRASAEVQDLYSRPIRGARVVTLPTARTERRTEQAAA